MMISPEKQAQYEHNRDRMTAATKQLRWYLRLSLALAGMFLAITFFVSARASTDDAYRGAEKFYFTMSIGVTQILLAIASAVLGWFASARKRAAAFTLIGIFGICALWGALHTRTGFSGVTLLLLLAGIALNLWALIFPLKDIRDLETQPGYPQFDPKLDQPAEYEAPLYVTARQSSAQMETLGTPAPAKTSLHKGMDAVPAADAAALGITDMLTPASASQTAPSPQAAMPAPAIALEKMADQAANRTGEQPQATLSAENLLDEMTPEAASHLYHPDAASLPAPEEVRARLAAMKQERESR